ncbi:hypothetical protein HZS_7670 [Henneguya salminicola]|nr:hypothetical protein HZS_7670 [Henneguya salminicola]
MYFVNLQTETKSLLVKPRSVPLVIPYSTSNTLLGAVFFKFSMYDHEFTERQYLINTYGTETKKFQETPTFLNGDFEKYAYFGMSVTSIGDINDDEFRDVAILAIYPNSKANIIYIYLGSDQGLSNSYSQKISITTYTGYHYSGYIILGQFDYNSDGVNGSIFLILLLDLAVSFPSKNKVAIIR